MPPRTFQYFAPRTLEEASSFLREHQEAKVLAGGMSLIPIMKMRLASPQFVVDISRIEGLEFIKESKGELLVGSMTSHHSIESSELVGNLVPLLAETASQIGDPQVRNLGTIGGSLAHCDPSGDWGGAVLALRGKLQVFGASGSRTIAIDDFLVDTFTTALKGDEIVTQVSVPIPPKGSGAAYLKLERKAGDFATVAVAVQLSVERRQGGDVCTKAGIGLTAVGAKNLRAARAESILVDNKLSAGTIAQASSAAANECDPTDDPLRGSSKYKREMVGLFTRRAIELALKRAKGGSE